jgi:hypothetical protein
MNNRFPATIPIQTWYKDHCFEGKTVFAAVESMILLAAGVRQQRPNLDVGLMEDSRFAKFLEIPSQADELEVLIECSETDDGRVQAKLLSQLQIGKMRRLKEHGELFFRPAPSSPPILPELFRRPLADPRKEVTADKLYRDLVPFGPSYHTLQETLLLYERGAWGKLRAPELPFTDPVQDKLGSPFPLDGAMHAACVLGQQFVDYAPFPTGFRQRFISRPTQPGKTYHTGVEVVSFSDKEQIYNLAIYDDDANLHEAVLGLCMRDVRRALR